MRKVSNKPSDQAEKNKKYSNENCTKPSKIIIYTKAVGHTA